MLTFVRGGCRDNEVVVFDDLSGRTRDEMRCERLVVKEL